MSVMDKLKKNSKIKAAETLSDSKFFVEKELINTGVPMVNVALSGDIDGGLSSGLTCLLYTSPSPRDATLSRMPSSA